jgi:hypothetical protein
VNNLAKQNAAFPFTDEEMETAKRTDLPDLLEHLGYTVHRLGSRYHTTREMDSIRINTTKIRNIKKYLLTVLFNAPSTMGSCYTALVAHDMAEGKSEKGGPDYETGRIDLRRADRPLRHPL